MGHYSRFVLRYEGPATEKQVRAAILKHHEYRAFLKQKKALFKLEDGRILLSEGWNGNDRFKWYEFDEDMPKISAELPGTILELERIGDLYRLEDEHDVWRHTYLDGQRVNELEGTSPDGIQFIPLPPEQEYPLACTK